MVPAMLTSAATVSIPSNAPGSSLRSDNSAMKCAAHNPNALHTAASSSQPARRFAHPWLAYPKMLMETKLAAAATATASSSSRPSDDREKARDGESTRGSAATPPAAVATLFQFPVKTGPTALASFRFQRVKFGIVRLLLGQQAEI